MRGWRGREWGGEEGGPAFPSPDWRSASPSLPGLRAQGAQGRAGGFGAGVCMQRGPQDCPPSDSPGNFGGLWDCSPVAFRERIQSHPKAVSSLTLGFVTAEGCRSGQRRKELQGPSPGPEPPAAFSQGCMDSLKSSRPWCVTCAYSVASQGGSLSLGAQSLLGPSVRA